MNASAANQLIANNPHEFNKALWSEMGLGDPLRLIRCAHEDAEAERVATKILTQKLRFKYQFRDFAILYRGNHQSRLLEMKLQQHQISYKLSGGSSFFSKTEIKDVMAYLRLLINQDDDNAFLRIINTPRRGLGESSLKSLHQLARARGVPLMQAGRLMVETEELKPKSRKALADLIAAFDRWRSLIDTMRHTELAELILDESGYTAMWQAEKSPQAQSKLENLKELIRFMEEFDTLAGFMEHVSLVMDAEAEESAERVNLMTLHSAKGLEFDVVFLPGWDEGLLPHQRSLDESGRAGLEEDAGGERSARDAPGVVACAANHGDLRFVRLAQLPVGEGRRHEGHAFASPPQHVVARRALEERRRAGEQTRAEGDLEAEVQGVRRGRQPEELGALGGRLRRHIDDGDDFDRAVGDVAREELAAPALAEAADAHMNDPLGHTIPSSITAGPCVCCHKWPVRFWRRSVVSK